jgi:transposase
MQTITTIGLDIAKSVLHGVDAAGQVVIRRQLKRRYVLAFFQKLPTCLVGTLPIGSRFRCFRTGRPFSRYPASLRVLPRATSAQGERY